MSEEGNLTSASQVRCAVDDGASRKAVDSLLVRFGSHSGAGNWSEAIAVGLELVAVLETLAPDIGFGVLANMAGMNAKLGKQTHTPNGPIDVHLLRAYLYGEYARAFLEANGPQMQDIQRARAYVEHEATLHMYVGMMVSSAFKLPHHQAAATRAVSDLQAHERSRFGAQIAKLLRDRQPPEPATKKGCFIATAAMGTSLAPEIGILSDFRDGVLLSSAPGRVLVSVYERFSPPIAGVISRSATLRALVRVLVVRPATRLVRWSGS